MRRFASSSKSINLTVSDERVLKRFPSSPHTTYTPTAAREDRGKVGEGGEMRDREYLIIRPANGVVGQARKEGLGGDAYPEAHVVEPLARGHPARGAGGVEDHVEVRGL